MSNHNEEAPEPVEVLMHCKACCEETLMEVPLHAREDPSADCPRCSRSMGKGELETGECCVCGLTRDSGQVALGNWSVEDVDYMTCSSCVEANA